MENAVSASDSADPSTAQALNPPDKWICYRMLENADEPSSH
jgi:hypothetical protein